MTSEERITIALAYVRVYQSITNNVDDAMKATNDELWEKSENPLTDNERFIALKRALKSP
jgi:hypothetical protein